MARGDPHHVIAFPFCLPLEVNIRLIHSNPPLSPFSIMHVFSLTTTSVCGAAPSIHAVSDRHLLYLFIGHNCIMLTCRRGPLSSAPGTLCRVILHHSRMPDLEFKDFNDTLGICATPLWCFGTFCPHDWGTNAVLT